MAVNQYFNLYKQGTEQDLISDLVTEAIAMYGYDVQYLPRELNKVDEIYHEDSTSEYNSAFQVDMYIKNVEGFGGQNGFFSQWSSELRDTVTFTVSIKRYQQLVGDPLGTSRPLEGDLIFFELDNKLFLIKKVNKYSMFFQVGALQVYDLICELFEYSNEKFNTGIEFVDSIESTLSVSTAEHSAKDSNGVDIIGSNGRPTFANNFIFDISMLDSAIDNPEITAASIPLLDFDEKNPFGQGL